MDKFIMNQFKDFNDLDITSLYEYLNAMEMENRSRNQERIYLQAEIQELKSYVDYLRSDIENKNNEISEIKTQSQSLAQQLRNQRQKGEKLSQNFHQKELSKELLQKQLIFLKNQIKNLKGAKISGQKSQPSTFCQTRHNSLSNSRKQLSKLPNHHKEGVQSQDQQIKSRLEESMKKRILNKIEKQKERQINEIKRLSLYELGELEQELKICQQKLEKERQKAIKFQFLLKKEQQQKKKILQKNERNQRPVEKEKPKKVIFYADKGCQISQDSSIYEEAAFEKLKKSLNAALHQKKESKIDSQRTIKSLQNLLFLKQNTITKLDAEILSLKEQLQENTLKKSILNPIAPRIDDLEQSFFENFPTFREESLNIMREMEQQIQNKDLEIKKLSIINEKLKKKLISQIQSYCEHSELRQKLITALGEVAFYKSKVAKMEKVPETNRSRETNDEYGIKEIKQKIKTKNACNSNLTEKEVYKQILKQPDSIGD